MVWAERSSVKEKHTKTLETKFDEGKIIFAINKKGWAKFQTNPWSSFSHSLTDSYTIVYIARQLYTHSKNVSLLCFLYTKGDLCFSLGKYSPLATTKREQTYIPERRRRRGNRRRAAIQSPKWNNPVQTKGVANQNTQRKQTKQEGGLKKKKEKKKNTSLNIVAEGSGFRSLGSEKVSPPCFGQPRHRVSFLYNTVQQNPTRTAESGLSFHIVTSVSPPAANND